MRNIHILLAIAALTLSSCWHQEPVQVIRDKYSMMIPGDMSIETSPVDRNEDASLQYQNFWLEKYILVIDEPTQELRDLGGFSGYRPEIDQFRDLILRDIEISFRCTATNYENLVIDGLLARSAELHGTYEGIDIAVKMFFIQGKTDLYQIMVWTSQEKEYTVMPILEKAALSFDEH